MSNAAAHVSTPRKRRTPRAVERLDECRDRIPFDRVSCTDLREIALTWEGLPRQLGESLPDLDSFSMSMLEPFTSKMCILRIGEWRADEIEFSYYGKHATEYVGDGRPLVMQELRQDPVRSANYYDIRDRAGRAIDRQAPQYVRKNLSWSGAGFGEYETLMLPFQPKKGWSYVLQPVSAWTLHR